MRQGRQREKRGKRRREDEDQDDSQTDPPRGKQPKDDPAADFERFRQARCKSWFGSKGD